MNTSQGKFEGKFLGNSPDERGVLRFSFSLP